MRARLLGVVDFLAAMLAEATMTAALILTVAITRP